MQQLDALREQLPDAAKDIKLNLQAVLRSEKLTEQQTWGCALASAYFLRDRKLMDAIQADAQEHGLSEDAIDDAKAAAALMGMTTVYYRFRHLLGKESYEKLPPRLRMSRMQQVKTNKVDFEAFALAAAILGACEGCIKAHEKALIDHDLTEEHVNDIARIAAVVHAMSIATSMSFCDLRRRPVD